LCLFQRLSSLSANPTEMLYDGLIRFGQCIDDAISNPAFIKNVAKHSKLPYKSWWFEQDTYSFLGATKMSDLLQGPRHGCTLGAMQTVVAIERAIPILHAGPGCGSKLHRGLSIAGGHQGVGYAGGDAIPCTNMIEKDVVFGGTDKLRNVIDGTLKIMDGDFFVVLTGCTSDIIGDDVASVVKEFKELGVPIVFAETAGFKGDAYKGHELVLQVIIEQYLKPNDKKEKGLVNVFASVPRHDPFWEGDLI